MIDIAISEVLEISEKSCVILLNQVKRE